MFVYIRIYGVWFPVLWHSFLELCNFLSFHVGFKLHWQWKWKRWISSCTVSFWGTGTQSCDLNSCTSRDWIRGGWWRLSKIRSKDYLSTVMLGAPSSIFVSYQNKLFRGFCKCRSLSSFIGVILSFCAKRTGKTIVRAKAALFLHKRCAQKVSTDAIRNSSLLPIDFLFGNLLHDLDAFLSQNFGLKLRMQYHTKDATANIRVCLEQKVWAS